MVLMAVRDENRTDPVGVLDELGDFGYGEVHSGHIFFGKKHSGVHYDDVFVVLERHHVLTYFTEAAKGDYS